MQQIAYRKVNVPILLEVDADGQKRPRKIRWKDGNAYAIDKVLKVCRAASTKVGGCGMRYTVRIDGKETHLFEEDGKWFIEEEYIKEV